MAQTDPATGSSKVFTRHEYQEILLARMAGGDLYANEERMNIRKVDILLDKLRIAGGSRPIYKDPTQETLQKTKPVKIIPVNKC